MNRSRLIFACIAVLFEIIAAPNSPAQAAPRLPGEIVWTIGYDPKTFDPAKVDDQESETVRYLTAGVLLRFNRLTQQVEPELAQSWSLSPDGKAVTFLLRSGLEFSDGSSLTALDVAWSLRRVLSPATAAPVAQEFISPTRVIVDTPNSRTVIVHLPQRVIAIGKVFDEIAIEPTGRPSAGRITSGPFVVADYRRSLYIRLRRNPHYAGRDPAGHALPYAAGIRLDIVENIEQQIRLLVRGNYDLIDNIPPDYFELLRARAPDLVRDLGPSLNTEQIWFNQSPSSPLPQWERTWFQSRAFRVAVSRAIHRSDLARIAYLGHATPAYSFISPANALWYDRSLSAPHTDVAAARAGLAAGGFRQRGGHTI